MFCLFLQLNTFCEHSFDIFYQKMNKYKMIAHQNHIIDGDLKEATCKRPLKEAPLTVTSARGSNEVNVSDLQSPARMIKPDVDSPARVSNEC